MIDKRASTSCSQATLLPSIKETTSFDPVASAFPQHCLFANNTVGSSIVGKCVVSSRGTERTCGNRTEQVKDVGLARQEILATRLLPRTFTLSLRRGPATGAKTAKPGRSAWDNICDVEDAGMRRDFARMISRTESLDILPQATLLPSIIGNDFLRAGWRSWLPVFGGEQHCLFAISSGCSLAAVDRRDEGAGERLQAQGDELFPDDREGEASSGRDRGVGVAGAGTTRRRTRGSGRISGATSCRGNRGDPGGEGAAGGAATGGGRRARPPAGHEAQPEGRSALQAGVRRAGENTCGNLERNRLRMSVLRVRRYSRRDWRTGGWTVTWRWAGRAGAGTFRPRRAHGRLDHGGARLPPLHGFQGEWDLVCLALNVKRMQGLQPRPRAVDRGPERTGVASGARGADSSLPRQLFAPM